MIRQLWAWAVFLSPAITFYLGDGNIIAQSCAIAWGLIVCLGFAQVEVTGLQKAIKLIAINLDENNEFIKEQKEMLEEVEALFKEIEEEIGQQEGETSTKH